MWPLKTGFSVWVTYALVYERVVLIAYPQPPLLNPFCKNEMSHKPGRSIDYTQTKF